VRKRAGLSAITVVNFDWHGNIKALGEAKTVEVGYDRALIATSLIAL